MCTSVNLYNQLLINNNSGSWTGPSFLGFSNNYQSQFDPNNDLFGTYTYISR